MRYWFRTVLGLLLFFSAVAAFDYSVYELIAHDGDDTSWLVAAVPLAVVAALGGGALFAARGPAPGQAEDPQGISIAVPWWSLFFIAAGGSSLAAVAFSEPEAGARLAGIVVGVIFLGLGVAPFAAGLSPRRQRTSDRAETRIAVAGVQILLALAAISGTLALMERLRDDPDRSPPVAGAVPLRSVAPDAPQSLFRSRPFAAALAQLEAQMPLGVLQLRVDPNGLRADLEVDAGVLRVELDRAARVLSRQELDPIPEESFDLAALDPAVLERIARALAGGGGPGLRGIGRMVASGVADGGRPGWMVFARDPSVPPSHASIDGRTLR